MNNIEELLAKRKISKILGSLIFPSTLKMGYAFLTAIPYLILSFLNYPKYYLNLRIVKDSLPSFALFLYIILQTFRGVFVVNDIRIILWTIFFFTLLVSQQIFAKYIFNFQDKDFITSKVINFSILSFVFYELISFISYLSYGDRFEIQEFWLSGTSAAFTTAIPLFSGLFLESTKKSRNLPHLFIIIIYTVICVLSHSRLGTIFLIFYLLFLIISKINIFKITLKKGLFSTFLFIFISLSFYQLISNTFNDSSGMVGLYEQNIQSENKIEAGGNLDRFASYVSTFNKMTDNVPEFFFGTGWYTSKTLQIPYYKEARRNFGLVQVIDDKNPISVDSSISLFSDLGFVGFLLILNVYRQTFKNIYSCKNTLTTKYFFFAILVLHFFCIFVGFQYASITYWLTFLPKGILTSQLDFQEE